MWHVPLHILSPVYLLYIYKLSITLLHDNSQPFTQVHNVFYSYLCQIVPVIENPVVFEKDLGDVVVPVCQCDV